MGRIVYVNGQFLEEHDAKVSVFDRGFLFADGVYEVSSVLRGQLIENEAHLNRLARSMDELRMKAPLPNVDIEAAQKELIKQNQLEEGLVYLQVSRGVADRDFAFPTNTTSSLVMFTQSKSLLSNPAATDGITVISLPDIRWRRRDIKTVGLLPASMAKQAAMDAGAQDAWMIEDGFVTEGSSNNAYIVTQDNVIVTRHLNNDILHGITRKAILAISKELGLAVEERAFTIDEAYQAKEAFITSASTFCVAVTAIDGNTLGDGKPGEIATRLRQVYIEKALASIS